MSEKPDILTVAREIVTQDDHRYFDITVREKLLAQAVIDLSARNEKLRGLLGYAIEEIQGQLYETGGRGEELETVAVAHLRAALEGKDLASNWRTSSDSDGNC